MPTLLHSLPAKALLAVVVTGALVGVGVLRAAPPRPADPVDPLATRLASVDTGTLVVRRTAFCDDLPEQTAAAALGSPVVSRASWRPGQTVQIGEQVKDVTDEYGCSWTSSGGQVAHAWVFAPPVTRQQAAALARARPSGCEPAATPASPASAAPTSVTPASAAPTSAAPAFGAPTSTLTCGTTTLMRGLFGDAWLSCELSSTDLDLVGRWCVAVARAAG